MEGESVINKDTIKNTKNEMLPLEEPIQHTLDEALETTGCYGRFQQLAQILLGFAAICHSYQTIMSYFIADDPPWKCISKNTSNFCYDNFGVEFDKSNSNFSRRCNLGRDEWTYAVNKVYSFTTEFDLICEKASLAAFASGVYHIGGAFGVPISGLTADKYGRKNCLFIILFLNTIISIACSYVTNTWQLISARLFLGATGWPCYTIAFTYIGEFVTPKYRSLSSNIMGSVYYFSILLIDLLAYHCRKWRNIQLYSSFPAIIPLLFLPAFPGSPRWYLSSKKNIKSAEAVIKLIGKLNRYSGPPISLKAPPSDDVKNNYFDIMRNRKVLLTTVVLGFVWMTAAMSWYMIVFQSSNLGGDMYTSYAYSTLALMPAVIVIIYPLNRFGRKKCLLSCLIITAVSTGSTVLIPATYPQKYTIRMIMLSLASVFAACVIQCCFIWTFEIFPTSVRLQGSAICVTLERIGAFIAPFLTTVLQQYYSNLPYTVAMVALLLSATGGLFLPETNMKDTRETFDDFFGSKPDEKPEVHDMCVIENGNISEKAEI